MSNHGSLPQINYMSPAQRSDATTSSSVRSKPDLRDRSAGADRFDRLLRDARRTDAADRPEPSRPDRRDRPDDDRRIGRDGRRLPINKIDKPTDADRSRTMRSAEPLTPEDSAPVGDEPSVQSDESAGQGAVTEVDGEHSGQSGRQEAGEPSTADVEGENQAATPSPAGPAPAGDAELGDDLIAEGVGTVDEVSLESASVAQSPLEAATEPAVIDLATATSPADVPDDAGPPIEPGDVDPVIETEVGALNRAGDQDVPVDRTVAESEAADTPVELSAPAHSGPGNEAATEPDAEVDQTLQVTGEAPTVTAEAEGSTEPALQQAPTTATEQAQTLTPQASAGAAAEVVQPTGQTTGPSDQSADEAPADSDAASNGLSQSSQTPSAGPAAGSAGGSLGNGEDPALADGRSADNQAADQADQAEQAPSAFGPASTDTTDGGAEPLPQPVGQATTAIASPVSANGATVTGVDLSSIGQLTAAEGVAAGIDASALAPSEEADGADPLWRQIRRALGSLRTLPTGEQQMTIRLRPAELGSVVVRINNGENGTAVSLVTESSAAANQLNQQRQQLLNDLEDGGLNGVAVDIDSGTDDADRQTEESQADGGNGDSTARNRRAAAGAESELARGYGSRRDRRPSTGLVDVDL